jgi:hypothetical protein
MPNVIKDVTNATQRMAFFDSEFMNRITNTPRIGKKVSKVRGCRRNSIFIPHPVFPVRLRTSSSVQTQMTWGEGFYLKIKYPTIMTTPNNTDSAYERTNPFWTLRMTPDNHWVDVPSQLAKASMPRWSA